MYTYAVGYMSFFENDLKVKVVRAESWKHALEEAFGFGDELSDDMDEAKRGAFNMDLVFDVVRVE